MEKNCLNELSKEHIEMQYNYDFHLHYQPVDASQMLGEFESFFFNRNVHNVCRYRKLNFVPAPHLIWGIAIKFEENSFCSFSKKLMGKAENSCFSTPTLRRPWDLCQIKSML